MDQNNHAYMKTNETIAGKYIKSVLQIWAQCTAGCESTRKREIEKTLGKGEEKSNRKDRLGV